MDRKEKATGGNRTASGTALHGGNSTIPQPEEKRFLELAARLDRYGQTLAVVRGDDVFRFMAYIGQWTKFFTGLDEVEAFASKLESWKGWRDD